MSMSVYLSVCLRLSGCVSVSVSVSVCLSVWEAKSENGELAWSQVMMFCSLKGRDVDCWVNMLKHENVLM